MNNTSSLLAAQTFLARGLRPIPLKPNSKIPSISDWPNFHPTEIELPSYFTDGINLGMLLGRASDHIIDIDLDWPEAGQLAPLWLPNSWQVGRGGQIRHMLIQSQDAKTIAFDAPVSMGQKRRIVEILSDGKQVMVPPSIHPNGEKVEWITPFTTPIAKVRPDELIERVKNIAGTSLLLRLWPDLEGSRHDVTLALAGSLYHAKWPEKRIIAILTALLTAANDNEKRDRARAIQDTLAAAKAGKPVTGLPKLAEYLPAEVVNCLKQWWQLGEAPLILTIGGKPFTFGDDDEFLKAAQAKVQDSSRNNVIQLPQQPPSTATLWPTNEWPELLEFESVDGLNTVYPIDTLGPLLGGTVRAIADRVQVPIPLAAQCVLTAAATTVHAYYNVLCDNRTIPLCLWLVFVGEPGERKTSADEVAFQQIESIMQTALMQFSSALTAWESMGSDKAEASPTGPRPRQPVWYIRDKTSEGLINTLYYNWPAITLTNSDAAAWLGGYSMREGRDIATAATLSSLWSGTSHIQVRASQKQAIVMFNRRLSMSLMIQPEIASRFFESNTLSGQGFVSRCLPSFPQSTIGTRPYQKFLPDPRLDAFYAVQTKLLGRVPSMNLDTGDLTPAPLPLDSHALAAWINHYNFFEAHLLDEYQPIKEFANKAPEQLLRIAGVRAAMEQNDKVTVQHIEDAATLTRWYMDEWLSISGRLNSHRKEVSLPKQLLEWMRENQQEANQNIFTVQYVYKSGPRIFRGKSQLANEAMLELMRRGYVRPQGKGYELRTEKSI